MFLGIKCVSGNDPICKICRQNIYMRQNCLEAIQINLEKKKIKIHGLASNPFAQNIHLF